MDFGQLADVFKIFGVIIALLNFIGIIFIYLVNKAAFKKIITNDLRHINDSLKTINKEQIWVKEKVIELTEEVSYIKGKSDANTCLPRSARRTLRVASVKKRKGKK